MNLEPRTIIVPFTATKTSASPESTMRVEKVNRDDCKSKQYAIVRPDVATKYAPTDAPATSN